MPSKRLPRVILRLMLSPISFHGTYQQNSGFPAKVDIGVFVCMHFVALLSYLLIVTGSLLECFLHFRLKYDCIEYLHKEDFVWLILREILRTILENYIVSEVLKSYHNNARKCLLWYYRDTNSNEINMVI